MRRPALDRRLVTLLAFPGLILAGFLVEQWLLAPRVAARLPDDDVAFWESHVRRNQGFAGARVRLGLAYEAVERLDEAQREYEAALALDPASEAATIGRYGVLERRNQRDLALADLAEFAGQNPRCAVCWHNLAVAYLDQGRLDEAADAAEALLASGLTVTSGMYSATDLRHQAFLTAGRVFAARGEHDRAVALFRDAARREPRDPLARIREARSLLADGRPGEALAALEQAEARLAPEDTSRRRQVERLRRRARSAGAGP